MAEKRKLAAMLAADVVGFGRLTREDEDRTLARLRALRSDLIDPTIALHDGRVVKRTGDGALLGRDADAAHAVARLLRIDPERRLSNLALWLPCQRPDHMALWTEGLRKARLPE